MKLLHRKFSVIATLILFSLLLVLNSPVTVDAKPDKEDRLGMQNALKVVEAMEAAWENVDDYTVTTYKKERHGGELTQREKIFTKFKRPFSVYMNWRKDDPPEHKNPNLGQEMIYEKGWNNNKIYASLGERNFLPSAIVGMAGFYYDWSALDPTSRAATYKQRHTIDEVPFGDVISRISKAVRAGIENPDDGVYFLDLGYKRVFDAPSGCIEGYLPGDKRDAYYDDRVMVCVDLRTNMPNQIVVRNDDGKVLENYRMENVKLNVGLDTQDFRPDNPEYNFE